MVEHEVREWPAFGHERNGIIMSIKPTERLARMAGASPETIVSLKLIEDTDGTHAGWIPASEDKPVLVQPKRAFSMQFTYSPAEEESRGRGKVVSLRVERA